jgi:non-specific serine/threonine protein kinase
VFAELVAAAGVVAGAWQSGPPLPLARTEVAGAAVGGEIFIVGGYLADGRSSRRVDVYSPQTRSWRRAPDLPVAVNHAMAAAYRGRLYVLGGYSGTGQTLRSTYVLRGPRWRRLAPMPGPRAAAGAAVSGVRLYVVGGVFRPGGLARVAFSLDLRRLRWTTLPGPTPREHLAAAALGGRVYAVAGRLGGLNSNQAVVESLTPGTRNWTAVPSLPEARGGTGAAAAGGRLVSAGGEAPTGTIASVYAFDPAARRWERLPDLPTPRHGLAVVGIGSRVFVIAGGPRPGLFVSGANESLDLRGG